MKRFRGKWNRAGPDGSARFHLQIGKYETLDYESRVPREAWTRSEMVGPQWEPARKDPPLTTAARKVRSPRTLPAQSLDTGCWHMNVESLAFMILTAIRFGVPSDCALSGIPH